MVTPILYAERQRWHWVLGSLLLLCLLGLGLLWRDSGAPALPTLLSDPEQLSLDALLLQTSVLPRLFMAMLAGGVLAVCGVFLKTKKSACCPSRPVRPRQKTHRQKKPATCAAVNTSRSKNAAKTWATASSSTRPLPL